MMEWIMIIEELVSIDVNPVESDEIVENENYLPNSSTFSKNSSKFILFHFIKIIKIHSKEDK